jgi:hypothetical protein
MENGGITDKLLDLNYKYCPWFNPTSLCDIALVAALIFLPNTLQANTSSFSVTEEGSAYVQMYNRNSNVMNGGEPVNCQRVSNMYEWIQNRGDVYDSFICDDELLGNGDNYCCSMHI